MSTGYGEGENRVSKAIDDALHSPLLNNNDIFNSKKVMLNISYSPSSELMMEEMNEIHEFMSSFSREVWKPNGGMAIDNSLETKVKITVLATGFGIEDVPMKEMDELARMHVPQEEEERLPNWKKEENKDVRRETYYGKDANPYQRSRRRHIYLFNPKTWTTPTSSAW